MLITEQMRFKQVASLQRAFLMEGKHANTSVNHISISLRLLFLEDHRNRLKKGGMEAVVTVTEVMPLEKQQIFPGSLGSHH